MPLLERNLNCVHIMKRCSVMALPLQIASTVICVWHWVRASDENYNLRTARWSPCDHHIRMAPRVCELHALHSKSLFWSVSSLVEKGLYHKSYESYDTSLIRRLPFAGMALASGALQTSRTCLAFNRCHSMNAMHHNRAQIKTKYFLGS